ncbi:MAG: serine/threonine-protein kinase, partial [Planctomycetota bacterium]|nr:serine/threonine-protein kinase [Planctomycetota bacterium]
MVDRNLLQGQHLLNEGLSTREYLSEAYRSLAQHPGKDLCAVLVLKGWIDPLQADRARQHVDFLMLSGSGIVPIIDEDLSQTLSRSGLTPIVDEDLSQTLSVNQAFGNPLASNSDLLPTINENIASDFQPTISGVIPAVNEIRSAIIGQQSLDNTVIPGKIEGMPSLSHDTTADSESSIDIHSQGLKRIGDYEILSEISHGGVGAVYVAQNLKLGNKVALKTLLAGKLASAESISRFKLEAETAARLSHPNMVKVLDVGEFEGNHFLVMELIEGSSLKEVITDSPLEPREATRLTETIARALAYAHRRAVLHRDIKPANILIRDSDGCPLITDFGLAKDFGSEAKEGGLTVTGQFIGTP